ncbi:separase, partial [Aspergillus sclerotialis]
MAVANLLSDSPVESVKLAVRSTSTCSNATVLSVQSLLRDSKTPETDSRKTTKTTAKRSTTTTKAARGTRTKTPTKDATLNLLTEEGPRLSTQEKVAFATELFNASLKTLSDELKAFNLKQGPVHEAPKTPLKASSPNKSRAKTRKTETTKDTQTPPEEADNGLVAVAECSRLALSCLRTLPGDESKQPIGHPNIRLEQGACVLAGRLITLGLNDLAYKELKSLKRRILQYLDKQGPDENKAVEKSKTKRAREEEPTKEKLSDLPTFPDVSNARHLHGLLVSFQANAMRLIATEKKASTVQKVSSSLQLSEPSSPANIILAAVESGSLPSDKGALQLQLLSNTVLSLCSGTRQLSETLTPGTRDQLKPTTALNLQLLSLEIKCMGWKLSGHQCEEAKEMWDPLARYLGSFFNHSKSVERSEFISISRTIFGLRSSVIETKKSAVNLNTPSVARITTILGQLAQEAGCYEEASKLFTEALAPLSAGQCLGLATVRCKLASVYFQALKSSSVTPNSKASHAISEATTTLGLPLKGSANDLDELLVESAKLKKLAVAWLGDLVTKTTDSDSEESDMVDRVRGYLQAFLRFLRRYIGRHPSEEHEASEREMFYKRASMSRSIVIAAVDSAVAIGKVSITSQRPPFEDMISVLSDCQRLLTTIYCNTEESDASEADNIGLAFVKISNLFWSRYIKEKECGKDYRHLVSLLKQSTNLLSTCSPYQRSVGFAAVKFERLAHLYLERDMSAESDKAFRQSINEHIEAGVLRNITTSAIGNFSHRVYQEAKSSGFMLSRVLSASLKMKLRRSELKVHYDFEDGMDQQERGLLLEWQMGMLTDLHAHSTRSDHFRSAFSSLLSEILDLYTPDDYPVRRLRAILCAIRFSLERPGSLDASLLQNIIEEGKSALTEVQHTGNDSALAPFETHIKNSLHLTIGLHQGNLRAEDLSQVITSWTSIVKDCRDQGSLESRIADMEYWVLQIKSVIDYTEIHGLWKIQLSALELILRITEIQELHDYSDATIILSRLVLQYCRLGHCKRAGDLLSRADQYLTQHEVSPLATLSHKLAQVEYLLETGDVDKAASILSAARVLYEKNQKKQDLTAVSVLSKISWERLVADAAFIHSRLSFAQGLTTQALFFAKLSVRLNCRLWAKVEKIAQKKQDKLLANGTSEMDSVVEGISKLDVSQHMPESSISYSQGTPFWPHIGSHHAALLNLSSLSAHHGLFQDAIYYGEQALKINKSLNASVRLVASQAHLGSHWILGGHISEGQELLEAAAEVSKQVDSGIELASLQMGLASLYKAQGRYKDELRVLVDADKILSAFSGSGNSEVSPVSSGVAGLEDGMDKLKIHGTTRTTQQQPTTGRRTRAATTTTRARSKTTSVVNANPPALESKSLLRLRGDILREQAGCSRALRDFDKATNLLNDARKFSVSKDSQIPLHIRESEHLLAEAIRRFATHAVYCVLPESTISSPALQSPKKLAEAMPSGGSTKSSATRRQRAPSKATHSKASRASEDFCVMLSKAGDCLNSIFDEATVLGSTLDGHAASRLMSRISMLTHATTPGSSLAWPQSPATFNGKIAIAFSKHGLTFTEIGRIGAFARERRAIDIDKQLTSFSNPLLWPSPSVSAVELDDGMSSDFTKEYVDILPESWNVLSLSLSADRTEFVVSRLRKDHSPFLLRLPLRRGNDEDEDEQFTFDDGQEEMKEIIKLANESSHAARSQADKNSKKEWWRNREILDRRLENLLQNIENVWFGGFRGVFSPVPLGNTPLSRFAKAFQTILDNHLPSRRKGSRSTAPKLTLHQNVLELFVGIQGLEDQEDPEETLMDLLYFVVDILQFQGERNAYDEIDFDMMVVETLDALRSYHNAVADEQQQAPNRTVLILDKSLHMFPWESLPCLQGYPVCRVPSLECLRERVLQFRSEKAGKTVSGHGINRNHGSYILNPGGDLQTTQGTFNEDLSSLKGWTGIVNREPSEEEFKQCLSSNDLCLYFGHGSGAQYIRGRTIKRLEKCAVTFLMGCSSGTLTEAGEYEPYGTPMNYLHAGSPALVATLWDVTDKDIDRFARSTFDRWGLFGKSSGKPGIALDDAVAGSRKACVMRFLNGAAPVIYGVPG